MPYRKDIDGLRAVAVVAVILFHFGLGCPGGYAGVDVFFVISGFLIGSIVLAKTKAGTFSMADFWQRRIRRLLPALFVVVVAVAAAGCVWLVPAHLEELGKSILAQPALAANVYFFQESGYFETSSEHIPLLHTWSLAVEEQFYLALPFLLPLFLRGGASRAFVGIGIITALSLSWSVFSSKAYPSFAFYLIFSRAWELNIGVLLALHLDRSGPCRRGRAAREAMAWSGLAMVLATFFLFGAGTLFPSYTAALPCLGTALLIFAHSRTEGSKDATSLERLLSWSPVVFVGKISYSLYLWHWPVFVFLGLALLRELGPLETASGIAASFALSVLSWKFVEKPVRERRFPRSTRSLLLGAAVAVAAMIGIGAVFSETEGLPERFPAEMRERAHDHNEHHGLRSRDFLLEHGTLPTLGRPKSETDRHILVWGDSHALSLLPVLETIADENDICLHVATQPSTPPLVDTYTERIGRSFLDWGNAVVDYARAQGVERVLLHARWRNYTEGPPDRDLRNLVSDADLRSRTPEQAETVFREALGRTIEVLTERGIGVYFLDEVPYQPRSVPETVLLASLRGVDPNTLGPLVEEQKELSRRIEILLAEILSGRGVVRLDPKPFLLAPDGRRFALVRDDLILFSDQHHLSPNGSAQLRPLLEPIFVAP